MSRLVALLGIITVISSLNGCGSDTNPGSNSRSSSETKHSISLSDETNTDPDFNDSRRLVRIITKTYDLYKTGGLQNFSDDTDIENPYGGYAVVEKTETPNCISGSQISTSTGLLEGSENTPSRTAFSLGREFYLPAGKSYKVHSDVSFAGKCQGLKLVIKAKIHFNFR